MIIEKRATLYQVQIFIMIIFKTINLDLQDNQIRHNVRAGHDKSMPNQEITQKTQVLISQNLMKLEIRVLEEVETKTVNDKLQDGSTFTGKVRKDNRKKEGFGIYIKGAYTYQGSWLNDKKHGFGEEKFKSGNWYEGQYMSGKMQGYGCFEWKQQGGRLYEGQWHDGRMHGLGRYTKNGNKITYRFYQFGQLNEELRDDPSGQWKNLQASYQAEKNAKKNQTFSLT